MCLKRKKKQIISWLFLIFLFAFPNGSRPQVPGTARPKDSLMTTKNFNKNVLKTVCSTMQSLALLTAFAGKFGH